MSQVKVATLKEYDLVIAGCPTWEDGELQSDWFDLYDELVGADLSGTKVAFFGLGDQEGYPETYQDAIGILHERFSEAGAEVGIGYTDPSEHDFDESVALVDGKFCGLAIDQDNEADLTEGRVTTWVAQLKSELG